MFQKVVQPNEDVIRGKIRELIRGSIEELFHKFCWRPKLQNQHLQPNISEMKQCQGYHKGHYTSTTSSLEMYLAGISVQRVEDITETLWGSKHLQPQLVS